MESHWLERQDRFTRRVLRLDRFLGTRGALHCAEVTVRLDKYRYPVRHHRSVDPSDKGSILCCADADLASIGSDTFVADIYRAETKRLGPVRCPAAVLSVSAWP